MRISDYLPTGERNAITAKALKNLLGIKDSRLLSRMIEAERHAHAPICASSNAEHPGYYLAADAAEMKRFVDSLSRRVNNVGKTLQRCRETWEAWPDDD